MKSVELTQVQRQTTKEYREAVKVLRRNAALGFERLDATGAVREVPWLDRAHAVAQAFADAELQGRKPLVVCATHGKLTALRKRFAPAENRLDSLDQASKSGETYS